MSAMQLIESLIQPTEADKALLRSLAAQVREAAESEENQRKRREALAMNALKAEKPMVFTSPENAWNELLTQDQLECSHPVLQAFERQLKQRLILANEIKCDRVIYDFFELPWEVSWGNFGVEVEHVKSEGMPSGSWAVHDHPIEDLETDLDQLKFRELSVDRDLTHQKEELAHSIFGDLLPVRLHAETYWWTVGMTNKVFDLYGMEPLMMSFIDEPEGVHALMSFLRNEHMNMLDWFEQEKLVHPNFINDNVGSGGAGLCQELIDAGNSNETFAPLERCWGFCESQETVGVSAEMFAEFILPYQIPLAERFALNYYGCCEPMHDRFKYVKTIPRLRRVSVSPWSELQPIAEQCGRDYVLCRKPNPAPVCSPDFDEGVIRRDLRETLEALGDLNVEIIMKDTHTIMNEPWRIPRWVELAREEVEIYLDNR